MEFVDGWSPIQEGTTWPPPFDDDLEARPGPGLRAGRRHRQAVPGGLGGPGASRASASPTASTSARSTAGWPTWPPSSSDPLPGLDVAAAWLRGHQPSTYKPGHHARRLPVRQRDVPPRRAGPAGRHRRLGDGDGRRPAARPGLGHQRLARRHRAEHRVDRQLRRLHRHAVARRAARLLRARERAAASTRSTTT